MVQKDKTVHILFNLSGYCKFMKVLPNDGEEKRHQHSKCSNLFCILYFCDKSTVPDTKEVPGGGGAEVHLKSDLTNSMMHPSAEKHLSKM